VGITSRVAGTAAAIGLTLALVGCAGSNSATPKAVQSPADNGVAALSAQEILAASQNAVVKARSFTGTGTTYEGGKQYPLSLKASDTGFHFKLGNQYEFKDEGEAAGPEDDSILYVAMTGDPFPLAIEAAGPKADTGTFSDFGAAIEVTAPAPGQVVTTNDLAQLG